MAQIDLVKLADEAAETIQANLDTLPLLKSIMLNPYITERSLNALTVDPLAAMSIAIAPQILTSVQILLMWYYEMGRLYGRQEVTDEMMEGVK